MCSGCTFGRYETRHSEEVVYCVGVLRTVSKYVETAVPRSAANLGKRGGYHHRCRCVVDMQAGYSYSHVVSITRSLFVITFYLLLVWVYSLFGVLWRYCAVVAIGVSCRLLLDILACRLKRVQYTEIFAFALWLICLLQAIYQERRGYRSSLRRVRSFDQSRPQSG